RVLSPHHDGISAPGQFYLVSNRRRSAGHPLASAQWYRPTDNGGWGIPYNVCLRLCSLQIEAYAAFLRQLAQSSEARALRTTAMTCQVSSTVSAAALRSRVLSLAKTWSIGLRCGL